MSEKSSRKDELVAEAIFALANEIKYLGFGRADNSAGLGAIEGLTMHLSESHKEIASSIQEVASSLDNVAEAIRSLAEAVSEKEK